MFQKQREVRERYKIVTAPWRSRGSWKPGVQMHVCVGVCVWTGVLMKGGNSTTAQFPPCPVKVNLKNRGCGEEELGLRGCVTVRTRLW